MIALDNNGNFAVNGSGLLYAATTPGVQNAKGELRCQQGSWFLNPYFGRSELVWTISQSPQDRSLDIERVTSKYCSVTSVSYNSENQQYRVQVSSA